MTITTSTPSLQDITDAWGQWVASQNGTTLHLTTAFDYAATPVGSGFTNLQCVWAAEDIVYGDGDYAPSTAMAVRSSQTYTNDDDVEQSHSFTGTVDWDRALTWTTTVPVALGTPVTVTLKVSDLLAGDPTTVSVDATMAGATTLADQQTWTASDTFTIPTHSSVVLETTVEIGTYDASYTQWISVTGSVLVWFNSRATTGAHLPVSGHYFYFIPVQNIFQDVSDLSNGLITNTDQLSAYNWSEAGIGARIEGTLTGEQGLSARADVAAPLKNSSSSASLTATEMSEGIALR